MINREEKKSFFTSYVINPQVFYYESEPTLTTFETVKLELMSLLLFFSKEHQLQFNKTTFMQSKLKLCTV